MPYITQERRHALAEGDQMWDGPGALNYKLTMILVDPDKTEQEKIIAGFDVIEQYTDIRAKSYTVINEVLGAITGASYEHMRRTSTLQFITPNWGAQFYIDYAADYEDAKRAENGDVYPAKDAEKEEQHT